MMLVVLQSPRGTRLRWDPGRDLPPSPFPVVRPLTPFPRASPSEPSEQESPMQALLPGSSPKTPLHSLARALPSEDLPQSAQRESEPGILALALLCDHEEITSLPWASVSPFVWLGLGEALSGPFQLRKPTV